VADLRIELLGGFRVAVDGRPVPESAWRRRKPAALLKLLALAPAHRLHREQLMDALWPDLAPPAAAANLRKALHQLRHALDAHSGAQFVESQGEVLRLPPDRVSVDVDSFRAALEQARRTRDTSAYEQAIELYAEGLLPDDRYEEWALERRDELQLELIAILEELASILEARGDLDGAVRAVRRSIAAEPLREDAHAHLIRLHALAGRRSDALDDYERLRRLLADELGAEPSAQTQRLYEEIRANQASDPELDSELWERVGDLRMLAGDATGAVRAFGSALESAAKAEIEAALRMKLAGAWLVQHRPDEAEPHLAKAEQLAEQPAEHGRVACVRANQAWERGDLDAAQRFADDARRAAEEHGSPDDLAAATEAQAVVSHFRGDWRQGLELEIERLPTGGNGGAPLARVYDIHHCIGQYHLYGDGLSDDVEAYARRALARAEQAEAVRAQAFAWCLLGESLLLRARWDEAAGCLERSCALHESLGTPTAALPWQRLGELAVCRGTPADADQFLRRASAIATVSPMASHLWGRIYATVALAALERGDAGAAIASARAAAAAFARYGVCPSCSALLNPVAAEAFAEIGDAATAGSYAASAERVADSFDSSAWRAMAESAAGSVAAAEGDAAEARERFEAAARLYARARQPYWESRSRRQADELLRGTPGERARPSLGATPKEER
jgi:DNA-binding SARP family transcriptional activator